MNADRAKRDRSWVVEMIGLDHVQLERVRASLRGSSFHVRCSDEHPSGGDADLYVVRADLVDRRAHWPAPVIACGPPGRLRSAFLAGCVDYLREPWTPEEMSLRALAALSRTSESYQFPWGTVSFEAGSLAVPAGLVPLTHHESRILRALLRNRGAPVSREEMEYAVQGRPGRAGGRSLDMHVSSLRRKIRRMEPRSGRFIVSVRGQGYMIP